MNSRVLLFGLVFPVFTSSVWGKPHWHLLPAHWHLLPLRACGLSATAATSGAMAPSPTAPIAAPAPTANPAPTSSSAATATLLGLLRRSGPGSGLPNVTPDEIKHDPLRARTGFGAPSKLNMRIEGDGVALPAGVGAKNQNQAKANLIGIQKEKRERSRPLKKASATILSRTR